MELQGLVEELKKTIYFENFINQYPEAYLAAGFFIIEDNEENKYQLDFFIPAHQKIAAFEWPLDKPAKIYEDKIERAEKIARPLKVDLDNLKNKIKEVIKDCKINFQPSKIIAILKDNNWNITCMSSSLNILKICMSARTGEVTKCDKASLMDVMSITKKS